MASVSEADQAADVFQEHRDELGFVNRAQCEEKDLVTVERGGEIVGAALGNHCVRKPQTTLYDIAVLPEYRREGLASELVERLADDSPHDKIVAKCPQELAANEFYDRTGWEQIDREEGKNRALNVWKFEIPETPDLITTGRPDLTEVAESYGWLRGSRLDDVRRYEKLDVSLDFIDLHWEEPDFDGLLAATMRHRPKYVVAGDYDGENYETINKRADQLRPYAENVIVVPHEPGEVGRVPEWCVVGYSTPSGYAGTDAPVWEYYGRDVHILGGNVTQMRELYGYLKDEIVSFDCNSFHRSATSFAKWWGKTSPQWNQLPTTVAQSENVNEAYENSLLNLSYALREDGVISL